MKNVLTLYCFLVASSYLTSARLQASTIFDDQAKTLVVNGYSTSVLWPILLQEKIDDLYGIADPADRVVTVVKAIQPGNPLANWIDVATGEPTQLWLDVLRPAIQASIEPVIVLAQQSLQGVYSTDRTVGIEGPNDLIRIEQGADAFELYGNQLLSDGAEAVHIATHIYKVTQEPEIENEKYALEALTNRYPDHLFAGPDVWTATEPLWPIGFQADQLHPNVIGAEAMADAWFDHLLAHDGNVPEPTGLCLGLAAIVVMICGRKRASYLHCSVVVLALAATLSPNKVAMAQQSPVGIYCSCPPTSDNSNSVLTDLGDLEFVDGVLVRLGWDEIEIAPGVYNWDNLDRQFQLATAAGLGISLGIVNGQRAPSWLHSEGAEVFEYDLRGETKTMPIPWDNVYLGAWDSFVQELGSRYADNATLDLVHITHSTLNGFEMQLPASSASGGTWEQAGYSTVLHVDSWNTVTDSFAKAFPTTALDIEIHPVLGPDDLRGIGDGDNNQVAQQVISYGVSQHPDQLGAFAAWWSLGNAQEVYPGMSEIIQSTAAATFGTVQIVGSVTNQPERFGGEAGTAPADLLELEFDETLELALSSGINYLEVWNADLLNPELGGLLKSVHAQIHAIPEPSSATLCAIITMSWAGLFRSREKT
ncbi:beta-galactosidase [Adhaeretor mobilis]|uniref:Glycoside hydrolase family 42 N-terminal domain-containing protein n=1 Tax=Adhaeretor mobilis TaxID=1930276 RepID=A0A517N2V9_9BACT|nr:beta-galactosidase [Adhaeretor mobilis]QDT01467.1 hypothetical protein HG15A2_48090 [Adhaeretor mobilis]